MTGLTVRGLTAGFGAQDVLREVDLDVPEGGLVGLLGANGAGKSTLLACLSGLHPARAGRARLAGVELLGRAPTAMLGLGVARTFQSAALAPDLDVAGHVRLGLPPAERGWLRPRGRVEPLLEALGLTDVRDVPAGGLPVALRQRVALARALASRPRLLLLDEPGAGLDDATKAGLRDILRALLPAGAAVLWVEHDRAWARRVADAVVVLDAGQIAAEPAPGTGAAAQDAGVPSAHAEAAGTWVAGDAPQTAGGPRAHAVAPGTWAGGGVAEEAMDPGGDAAAEGPGAPRGGAPTLIAGDLQVRPGERVALPADARGAASRRLAEIATNGPLTLAGVRLDDAPADVRARAGLYYLPERGAAVDDLTVQEDLQLTLGGSRRAAAALLAADPLLAARGGQRVSSLSGGERRWLGLVGAIARRPQALLLDEPTAGLAPALRAEAWRRLRALSAGGAAIVFVTADPAEAAAQAHRLG